MYCQCPNCETIFALSQEMLEAREGLVRCGSCREVFNASWYLLDDLPPEATQEQIQSSTVAPDQPEPGESIPDRDVDWEPPDVEIGRFDEAHLTGADSPKPEAESFVAEIPTVSPATLEPQVEQSSQFDTDPSDHLIADQYDSSLSEFDSTDQEPEYEPVEQGLDTAELQRRLSQILDVDGESNIDSELARPDGVQDHLPDSEPHEEIVLDAISLPRTMQGQFESLNDFLENEAQPEANTNARSALKSDAHGSLEEALSASEKAPPPMPSLNTPSKSGASVSGVPQSKVVADSRSQSAVRTQQLPDIGSLDSAKNGSQFVESIKDRPEQLEPALRTADSRTTQANQGRPVLRSRLRPPQKPLAPTSKQRDSNSTSTADDITLVEIPRLQPIRTAAWWLGSIFLILLTLFQLKQYFLVDLAQFDAIRPYLVAVCHYAGCEVPPRGEFALIELIDTRVNPHPDTPDALRVTASLINRAAFEQLYPNIQVTLTDRVGRIVGRRTYSPKQYLGSDGKNLTPNIVERITLDLAHPDESAVGYELELVSS